MRPMYCLFTLGLVTLGSAQVIEERSSVRNPDGSMTHNARSSFSHATFSEESLGPDGTIVGRTVNRDSTGKITGNEWTTKDGQKSVKPIDGGSDIGGRSTLGGFGGVGGLGSSFGSTGFGTGLGSGLGTPGFGSGIGSAGIGNTGFGAGYGGFPSGGLPWASFGNFGNQFGQQNIPTGFGQFPQFNFGQFGFQQPLMVPNYSKFLLGGVGSNPNIANDGHFANINPKIGFGPGFGAGGFGGGFGNPVSTNYKHEVDPVTGRQTYSYSEKSSHSSNTNTGGL